MGNPISLDQFLRLTDKNLNKVTENVIPELKGYIASIYNVKPLNALTYESYGVGAMPDIPAFNGKVNYQSVAPGYYNRSELKEFAGGLIFEKRLLDTKQFNVLNNRQTMLVNALNRTKTKYCVEPFDNAFSTANTFMTMEEGLSLCNTAHLTKAGVSTSTGFSNAGTSAFSKSALSTARINYTKIKNDVGGRLEIEPDTIFCGTDLFDTIYETVMSPNEPTSANNNINAQYHARRWKIVELKNLASTKNWFIGNSGLMKMMLTWLNGIEQEIATNYDTETFALKQTIYSTFAYHWDDWRFVYGNNVS